MTRAELERAFDTAYTAAASLTTTQCDPGSRGEALEFLTKARSMVLNGIRMRQAELDREEERRIIQLYRDGKLVEKA